MKIKILGEGVWGRAVYSVVSHNVSDISFIGREEYSDDQDVLIISIPVQSIRTALKYISFKTNTKIIINTSKGIEKETHQLPQQISREVLKHEIEYYSLIGPSFAQELMLKMPTVVNLGYTSYNQHLSDLVSLFHTDYFIVRPTNGTEALELAAAFKNMYAIICGLSEGLGYGINTRVALVIMAMEEFSKLCSKLNLKLETSASIGTTGDLILTCNSTESRNYTFGKYLAELNVEESINRVGSTTEGYHSLASIDAFEKKADIQLTLLRFIDTIVKSNDPQLVRERFIKFLKNVD